MKETRILVLSDMHGERKAVEGAKSLIEEQKFDTAVYLGDFSEKLRDIERNVSDAEYLIKELSGLAKVYALFGNCDVKEVRELLDGHNVSLHDRIIFAGKTAIAGWGGSHPTPFGTPSEFSEDEIEHGLEKLIGQARGMGAKQLILFTHEPPARTKADKISIGHVGSEALRRIIEKHQPDLHVAGHIHEAKSEDLVGKTRVINVGQAKHGHFLEVVAGKKITTREINV